MALQKQQFMKNRRAKQTRDGEMAGKMLAIVPAKQNIVPNGAFFVKNPTRKTQFITQQIQSQRPI